MTLVPNTLLDHSLAHLKPVELKVLLTIIRKTLGWNKEEDWISPKIFITYTGASSKSIQQAIRSLEEANWIVTDWKKGKRHFFLVKEKMFPLQREYSSRLRRKKIPPTKENYTKSSCTREKASPDKRQSIRDELLALGVIRGTI